MKSDHLILCGNAKLSSRSRRWKDAKALRIGVNGGEKCIRFQLGSLPQQLTMDLTPAAFDLMEIAAYVCTADQACVRGGEKEFEYGKNWRRSLRFEIPVRQPDLWNAPAVNSRLVQALSFLSDDEYEFAFSQSKSPQPGENYLFKRSKPEDGIVEEVMLFSGGLDSFAGAMQEIAIGRRKVALVSHVSTTKIGKPQRDLVKDIIEASGPGTPRPLHIKVTLNKDKELGREFTQRTRSFLFAAFAGVVAHALGRHRFRFYENGIVSLNLPTGLQIVGSRASRTTHPYSLYLLTELLSAVLGSRMEIENPFAWKTKTEIMQAMKGNGHARLCARTISCAHTMQRTTQYPHCGRCSQCVDRRFVALAAGFDRYEDPPEMYGVGWTTPLTDARDVAMLERYVGSARQIQSMPDELAFMQSYGEVAKALSFGPHNAQVTLKQIFDLHKRHADQVHGALAAVIRQHVDEIGSQAVPPQSPLGIVCNLSAVQSATRGVATATQPPRSDDFQVCDDTLSVWCMGKQCELGNTMEFRLIKRLARRRNVYVEFRTLIDDVWDGRTITKGAVHKTASNLRRKLRDAGITGVDISSPGGGGSYMLTISEIGKR